MSKNLRNDDNRFANQNVTQTITKSQPKLAKVHEMIIYFANKVNVKVIQFAPLRCALYVPRQRRGSVSLFKSFTVNCYSLCRTLNTFYVCLFGNESPSKERLPIGCHQNNWVVSGSIARNLIFDKIQVNFNALHAHVMRIPKHAFPRIPSIFSGLRWINKKNNKIQNGSSNKR